MKKIIIGLVAAVMTSAAVAGTSVQELQIQQAQQKAEAAAATAKVTTYRFVSICGQANCPMGPNPIWFGVYNSWTYAQCLAARAPFVNTVFGWPPRVLSGCIAF